MPLTRPNKSISYLRDLWPFLSPYKGRITLAFVLLCIGSATILVVPLAFRDLIDFGFGQKQSSEGGLLGHLSLNGHFFALFGLTVLWALTVSSRYYTVTWIGERITADLRTKVYAKVISQSPQFFETLQTGEVLSRLSGDTTLIQTVIGSSISMGLRSLFQFVGGMIMLAVTSFYLFSINLALIFIIMLPIITIGKKVKTLSRDSQDKIADASALAGEILNAVSTVQSYTQEENEKNRFAIRAEVSFITAIKRTRVRALLTTLIILAVMGSIVFVLWVGANQVHDGTMTGGQLASFVLYATLVAGGIGTIAEVWGDVMRAAGATERLFELLNTKSHIIESSSPRNLAHNKTANIQFKNVSFSYPSRMQVVALDDINFTISHGESIALVGPSGAGKTTIFQLLLRFYDVSSGAILFNGQDIRHISLNDLRNMIAIVPQDPVIFSTNALENIRYGRPTATDSEVLAAASSAQVDEFITQLPDGYQTFLGERGVRLSGGQRQRIAIARAILKNSPLLLLDEATSALDAESEHLVQQGLNVAMHGRTTIIIAHRLASVKMVDRILVLEHGKIVETGSAEDLRKHSGLYSRLANLQFEI